MLVRFALERKKIQALEPQDPGLRLALGANVLGAQETAPGHTHTHTVCRKGKAGASGGAFLVGATC